MLHPDLQTIVDKLYQKAQDQHIERITLEHLLLALITESADVQSFLLTRGVSLLKLTALERELDVLITDAVATATYVKVTRPQLSASYKEAFGLAEKNSPPETGISPTDLLLAIWQCRRHYGAQFLDTVVDVSL